MVSPSSIVGGDVVDGGRNFVLPPREIRTIIEKTANFVTRNGRVFEERVRERERANPKFSFLNSSDPYAPFYAWRLHEILAGRDDPTLQSWQGYTTEGEVKDKPPPKQPPDHLFMARVPNINPVDRDVVNLTALFAARQGKLFGRMLSDKEAGAFQFDFLRPQHSLHQLFVRLMEQYVSLLQQKNISYNVTDTIGLRLPGSDAVPKVSVVIGCARRRAGWLLHEKATRRREKEADELEKVACAQIDWHNFSLLDTISTHDARDSSSFLPPASLRDLQCASLEQKAALSLLSQGKIKMGGDSRPQDHQKTLTLNDGFTDETQPRFGESPDVSCYPVRQGTVQAVSESFASKQATFHTTMPSESSIAASSHSLPQARLASQRGYSVNTAPICPKCQNFVSLDEFDRHMREELHDRRWASQERVTECRNARSNLTVERASCKFRCLASQGAVHDKVIAPPRDNDSRADCGCCHGSGRVRSPQDIEKKRKREPSAQDVRY